MRLYHTTQQSRAEEILADGFDGERDFGHLESGFRPSILFTWMPLDAKGGFPTNWVRSVIAVDFPDEADLGQYELKVEQGVRGDSIPPDLRGKGEPVGEYAVPPTLANAHRSRAILYKGLYNEQLEAKLDEDKVLQARMQQRSNLGAAMSYARRTGKK
jgi:hypothetical protein